MKNIFKLACLFTLGFNTLWGMNIYELNDKLVDTIVTLHKETDAGLLSYYKKKRDEQKITTLKQTVKDLIRRGADINSYIRSLKFGYQVQGQTPITYIADAGNFDIVKFLMEQGADINKPSWHNTTNPLREAIRRDELRNVKNLLGLGADPTVGLKQREVNTLTGKRIEYSFPLDWAWGSASIEKALEDAIKAKGLKVADYKSKDIPDTALEKAMAAEDKPNWAKMKQLIQQGKDINTPWLFKIKGHDWMEYYPLYQAAYLGNPEIVRMLLEKGANREQIPTALGIARSGLRKTPDYYPRSASRYQKIIDILDSYRK